jgi:hypothetical protein
LALKLSYQINKGVLIMEIKFAPASDDRFNHAATELFNYINNDRDLLGLVEGHYQEAERALAKNEYCPHYLESDLMRWILKRAAKCYVVAYVTRSCSKEDLEYQFPFVARRMAAKLLIWQFEREIKAGNTYL